MATQTIFENVVLVPHPTARNAAVAAHEILPGAMLISVPALSTVLLTKEKGLRCDACHRAQADQSDFTLRRCSGCSSYWYCGETCQKSQWKLHHRQICKSYNKHVSSEYFRMLPEDQKLDALLLTQLVVETSQSSVPSEPFSVFMSLLPRPQGGPKAPLIFPVKSLPSLASDHIDDLYDRFDNNNYVVHSHLTPIAHGIFPWASRLFNHSCFPNSVARYIITPYEQVRMEVVALREIPEGEEVTIPYTDPAVSFPQRQHHLQMSYGFKCQCAFCQVQENMLPESFSSPHKPEEIPELEGKLQEFVFGLATDQTFTLPEKPLYETLPSELHSVMQDTLLTSLSEIFSDASNDGPYDLAFRTGKSIFAIYLCIYPPLYPQIGIHTLELAKTLWNSFITMTLTERAPDEKALALFASSRSYLSHAKRILVTFGPEGDPGGPLDEIDALEMLMSEEEVNFR